MSGRDYWTASIGGLQVRARIARDHAGRVVDLHASMGPPGNPLSLAMESVCLAASINLRAGVPLSAVLAKWRGQRFEPCGLTGDELAPSCTSVMDYMAQAIALRA